MNERDLERDLAEELIRDWEITATGGGYLVATSWHYPNGNRIEIYVRTVGDREDLYLVSDGGEVFSFLFSEGVDLANDKRAMKVLERLAADYGFKIVDYQLARGANDEELPQAIRVMVEAVKDAAFVFWHKLKTAKNLH